MASILKKRIAIHEKFLARKLLKLQQNKSHETIDSARNDRSLRFHNFANSRVNDSLCEVISCGPSFIPTNSNEDPSSHKYKLHRAVTLSLKRLLGKIQCLLLFELGSSKKETKKLLPEGYVKACDYCVPTVRDHCCYSGHPFVSGCDIHVDNLVSGSAQGSLRSHRED